MFSHTNPSIFSEEKRMKRYLPKLFSVSLILALMLSGFSTANVAQAAPRSFSNPTSTIFINEIHYDNVGADAGESIEVARPCRHRPDRLGALFFTMLPAE
jgi:hypothetical protein